MDQRFCRRSDHRTTNTTTNETEWKLRTQHLGEYRSENPGSYAMTAPGKHSLPRRGHERKPGEEAVTGPPMQPGSIPVSTEEKPEHVKAPRSRKNESHGRLARVERWLAEMPTTLHPPTHLDLEEKPTMPDERVVLQVALESQFLSEHQPHLQGAKLPHDPAPSNRQAPLDKGESQSIAILSLSLAAVALEDAPGHTRKFAPYPDHDVCMKNPPPSSGEEAIAMSHRYVSRKEEVKERIPTTAENCSRAVTRADPAKSGEERRTSSAPIGPPPTPRMHHRRSRAQRAARNVAWARPVLEHRSRSENLESVCSVDSFSRAPNFNIPIFFESVPVLIMAFVDRDVLYERAEQYFLEENTDTEDQLLSFVRKNRSRRRNRNRVARHRARRDAEARREFRLIQEREQGFNEFMNQAAIAAQQPAVPPADDAPARRRAPRRRAQPVAAPEKQAQQAVPDNAVPNSPAAVVAIDAPDDDGIALEAAIKPAFAQEQEPRIDLEVIARGLPAIADEPAAVRVPQDGEFIAAALADDGLPGVLFQAEFLQDMAGERPALRMRIRRAGPLIPGDFDDNADPDGHAQRYDLERSFEINNDSGRDTDYVDNEDDATER
ncbi:hypothetical protein QAD02_002408 [Eretmocerus hayati]|uniref:Uncharacterized protein n=1 Tax=Eretmocerus hayati TaxID=131215 RepID=A0ACC2NLI2_9HYME|nr:hypothetical protein QAD02_002408 [Eretmocerus hayati]